MSTDLLTPPPADDETTPAAAPGSSDDTSTGAAATDDTSTTAGNDTTSAPTGPSGRLQIPEDTKGRYVVLWARRPKRGDQTRPAYTEVDVVKAAGPEAAKRIVMGLAGEPAPFAEFLKHSAAQKPGILLRAVPAMHWPQDVKPTTYERPDPVLKIG
jgi:hypothetical protein